MSKIVKVQVINESSNDLPKYESAGAAGLDLKAYLVSPRKITLQPNERLVVKTGLFVAIPEGYELQIRSKSGLSAKHGIIALNAPGTIDSDYRGEIGVILLNTGGESFEIENGTKIAQAVLNKVPQLEWDEVVMLPKTERGDGGFGSTGE